MHTSPHKTQSQLTHNVGDGMQYIPFDDVWKVKFKVEGESKERKHKPKPYESFKYLQSNQLKSEVSLS